MSGHTKRIAESRQSCDANRVERAEIASYARLVHHTGGVGATTNGLHSHFNPYRPAGRLLYACSVAVFCACFADKPIAAPSEPTSATVTARTNGPELIADVDTQVLPRWPLQQFLMGEATKTPSSFYAPPRVPPPGLSPNARAGRGLSIGARHASWIIDGDEKAGYVFFYDRRGDGDLSDEAPLPFALTSTGWDNVFPARSTWEVTVRAFGKTSENRPTELVFRMRIRNSRVSVEYTNTRSGSILVRGETVSFSVTGVWGYYGLAPQRVFFDFDRDGKLEVDEWRYVRDKHVVLAGLAYAFRVSDSGDTLTLEPVKAASNYVRNRLTPGEPIKDIALFNIRGADVSLGKFRDKYVLLDFWSLSCPPCVVAIPQIARIANRQLVVVIGITPDANDDRLARFIASHNVTWDIVSEDHDSARIYSRLRIDRFPSYFLIGPDGRLVCADCSLEQVEELTMSAVGLP